MAWNAQTQDDSTTEESTADSVWDPATYKWDPNAAAASTTSYDFPTIAAPWDQNTPTSDTTSEVASTTASPPVNTPAPAATGDDDTASSTADEATATPDPEQETTPDAASSSSATTSSTAQPLIAVSPLPQVDTTTTSQASSVDSSDAASQATAAPAPASESSSADDSSSATVTPDTTTSALPDVTETTPETVPDVTSTTPAPEVSSAVSEIPLPTSTEAEIPPVVTPSSTSSSTSSETVNTDFIAGPVPPQPQTSSESIVEPLTSTSISLPPVDTSTSIIEPEPPVVSTTPIPPTNSEQPLPASLPVQTVSSVASVPVAPVVESTTELPPTTTPPPASSTPVPSPVEQSTTSTFTPQPPVLPAKPTTTTTPITTKPTIKPTTVNTSTAWLPSMIIAETAADEGSTMTGTQDLGDSPNATVQATMATNVGTFLPKIILPQATASPTAEGFKAITIGFKKALNYEFVVKNSLSSAQIFEFLPSVITDPFKNINVNNVQVIKLVPYSSSNVDYIITVVELLFPEDQIDALQSLILDPKSSLYLNADPSKEALANLIDSRVSITDLISAIDSQSSNASSNNLLSVLHVSSGSSDGSGEDADGLNVSSDNELDAIAQSIGSLDGNAFSVNVSSKNGGGSKLSKQSIIGIVVGSVVGVALYSAGVFMFILWRRRVNAKKQTMRSLIRLDSASTEPSRFSRMSSTSSTFSGESFGLDDEKSVGGDIQLESDISNKVASRTSFLSMFTQQSQEQQQQNESGEDRSKFIPEISGPINVKNSLGW